MRLPKAEHERHPWVISRIAPDFDLLDAWALPVHGGADDFQAVVETLTSMDPSHSRSRASSFLFAVRFKLGEWFGWDEGTNTLPIPGCAETSLRDRLPPELRGSADSSEIHGAMGDAAGAFVPVYRTDDEWAAEISNNTVHGVLQLGWVPQPDGGFHAQLGVYVKPRGRLGALYLRFIGPFRHLVVYPALMKQVERAWEARSVER
jgi:Protein of unknown function (DUF2867)